MHPHYSVGGLHSLGSTMKLQRCAGSCCVLCCNRLSCFLWRCLMLCHALQGKPTVVYPGENYGFPRSWFVMERTRKTGEGLG
jgi:hypothetical protein